MTDKNWPEFTAEEVNLLSNRARSSEYYKKCHKFVLEYLDMTPAQVENMSVGQTRWIWGIKTDLKESM